MQYSFNHCIDEISLDGLTSVAKSENEENNDLACETTVNHKVTVYVSEPIPVINCYIYVTGDRQIFV